MKSPVPFVITSVLPLLFNVSAFADLIYIPSPEHPTIQVGINAASDGDTVVVMEGMYKGVGNRNLDFNGKAITVRSRNPENDECMRATIIDAEGHGVIVRFIHAEGPNSVFEGFTLIAGDISVPVRGMPGFFEFSDNARPTTKRLCVKGVKDDASPESTCPLSNLAADTQAVAEAPWGVRLWDGNNPFHQPAATTDYYGSGDVDADGTLAAVDVSLAEEMAEGLKAASPRADVDGNGLVDARDVSLIDAALLGGTLPGWWNQLSDRSERIAWVNKIMAIDTTDRHPYTYWFVCHKFATQTFIHANSYRFDLFPTPYDGGQTLFNVPMYYVGVSSDRISHSINAVLVGNNPLDFTDWLFLEPQTDYSVAPGMWDMPYGSTVGIQLPCPSPSVITTGACRDKYKVEFHVDETGWTLTRYFPGLETIPTLPRDVEPDNRPDLWNPQVVSVNTGLVFFDGAREDMSRMTDIHMAAFPNEGEMSAIPITQSSQYSRLLHIVAGQKNSVYLLWTGKESYSPGVFYGELNTVTGELNKVARISDGTILIHQGRVVAASNGEIHAFWLEQHTYSESPHSTGIYWAHRTDSGWEDAVNLTADWNVYIMTKYRDYPNTGRYYFDVALLENDAVILLGNNYHRGVYQRYYDGMWTDSHLVASPGNLDLLGVDAEVDSQGILHLAYWTGYLWDYDTMLPDCLGNLKHIASPNAGGFWEQPKDVDLSGLAGYPSLIRTPGGSVSLVWVRKVESQMVPIWSQYVQGVWQPSKALNVSSATNAWYPTGTCLSNGKILLAWSSKSDTLATIETHIMTAEGNFDQDGDGDVDGLDLAGFAGSFDATALPFLASEYGRID